MREGVDNGYQSAPGNTALYQAVGARLVCFVVVERIDGTHECKLLDLGPIVSEVEELASRLRTEWMHLCEPRLHVHAAAFLPVVRGILQELHGLLFSDVSELAPGRSLTVIPTGGLATIPFAALHDGMSHVLEHRTVTMSPGLPGKRWSPDARERSSRQTRLVVGVPDDDAPHVNLEVEQVAEITGGELIVGQRATAQTVRSAIANATVVHLAGHSTFHSANPWLSAFEFADRNVTAAELSEWDFAGKTVVFSSCSSGQQANLGEDETLGLPRALLAAGAREVVVNLWPVDDLASVGLMSTFHRELQFASASSALRKAQLQTKKLHEHPFFWASGVVCQNPVNEDS